MTADIKEISADDRCRRISFAASQKRRYHPYRSINKLRDFLLYPVRSALPATENLNRIRFVPMIALDLYISFLPSS